MPNLTIKENHPARKRIADLPNYFDSVGDALLSIDSILRDYDIELAGKDLWIVKGDEGSTTIDLCPVDTGWYECPNCAKTMVVSGYNNLISFSWYRMSSGRWEIVAYIS